jgi:hypothetical protein
LSIIFLGVNWLVVSLLIPVPFIQFWGVLSPEDQCKYMDILVPFRLATNALVQWSNENIRKLRHLFFSCAMIEILSVGSEEQCEPAPRCNDLTREKGDLPSQYRGHLDEWQ